MSEVFGHDVEACRLVLVGQMAKRGVEVTVSTAPHLVPTSYEQGAFVCPHGTRFYMEPTNEQVAEWRRDGVR